MPLVCTVALPHSHRNSICFSDLPESICSSPFLLITNQRTAPDAARYPLSRLYHNFALRPAGSPPVPLHRLFALHATTEIGLSGNSERSGIRNPRLDGRHHRRKLYLGLGLKTQTNSNPFRVRTITLCQRDAVAMRPPGQPVGMKVHRVHVSGDAQVLEVELSLHMVEESVLNNQNKMSVQILECPRFVMKLHENGLGRHLPIHAARLS